MGGGEQRPFAHRGQRPHNERSFGAGREQPAERRGSGEGYGERPRFHEQRAPHGARPAPAKPRWAGKGNAGARPRKDV